MGHCIDAKILPNEPEKPQTTMFENRYFYPRVDSSYGHFSMNRKQHADFTSGIPDDVYLCLSHGIAYLCLSHSVYAIFCPHTSS